MCSIGILEPEGMTDIREETEILVGKMTHTSLYIYLLADLRLEPKPLDWSLLLWLFKNSYLKTFQLCAHTLDLMVVCMQVRNSKQTFGMIWES